MEIQPLVIFQLKIQRHKYEFIIRLKKCVLYCCGILRSVIIWTYYNTLFCLKISYIDIKWSYTDKKETLYQNLYERLKQEQLYLSSNIVCLKNWPIMSHHQSITFTTIYTVSISISQLISHNLHSCSSDDVAV